MKHDAATAGKPAKRTQGEPAASGQGWLADPVVRIMTYVSIGMVVLFLVTAISVLATGVTQQTGPRTVGEMELAVASAQLKPGTVGDAWVPFINALMRKGDTARARVALTQARASVSATMPVPGLDLAEARLYKASGDNVQAVTFAENAMSGFDKLYKERLAQASKEATATRPALSPDYYNAALVKAYGLEAVGRWKDAVAMFDLYIKHIPTASDILTDRGEAKANLGDKAGAEKDFRAALKFVPYDEKAKAGLKKIGVAE